MSLLKHPEFRRLWTGQTASMFGTYVSRVAMPLVAATALAATPFQLGLLYAAQTVAFLVIGLPAGVWVDRLPARPVLVLSDTARALLLCSVPLAWWFGWLTMTQLLVVTLLGGVAAVFYDVAYQSYLPTLVGKEHLLEGNAKLESSRSVSQVAGPAVGGGLADLIGASNAVGFQALCYATSAASIFRISAQQRPQHQRERKPMLPEIAAGLRYVLGDPLIRAITGSSATFNFSYAVATPLLIVLLVDEARLPQWMVGALMAFGGIGGLVGAMTTQLVSRRFGPARMLWLPFLVCMPAALLVPLTQAGWGVLLFALPWFVVNYGLIVYSVAQMSFRQSICPDEMMSRLNATVRFFIWGIIPLGGVIGGALGEWIDVRAALALAGAGMVLSAVWVLLSPLRSMRELPTSKESRAPATQHDND
ncbi:MFS transporter [Saccharopolyspora phatthalungensis]|uniref:MFS family permease n=1 Tax=Saccharopolyspora phatthalungensis TaxID=664693 RepID=A0A840QK10_9PSEU|nr:MFS transporter [Saccharopolyspora phatthalungensis]MBB5159505.1 MFS family permease [Saccharopolyspora phatthalungensis]